MHTHTLIHKCAHTHAHARHTSTRTHTNTHTQTHTHAHTHIHTHTLTYTHMHTHTRAHTHTRTHTYTHMYNTHSNSVASSGKVLITDELRITTGNHKNWVVSRLDCLDWTGLFLGCFKHLSSVTKEIDTGREYCIPNLIRDTDREY